MSTVRILVADDHEVVRRGVKTILQSQPAWEVCGEAANGRDATEQARRLRPDVVILDIGMPELNGLEAARRIRKLLPKAEVLILTVHESGQLIHDVLEAGARGYLLKSDAGKELITAVKTLLLHKPFFTPKVSETVLQGYLASGQGGDRTPPAKSPLTAREREIVQLLAEGMCIKEIAAERGISPKTVETHRANIMHKLGVDSVAALVHYALRSHLIDL